MCCVPERHQDCKFTTGSWVLPKRVFSSVLCLFRFQLRHILINLYLVFLLILFFMKVSFSLFLWVVWCLTNNLESLNLTQVLECARTNFEHRPATDGGAEKCLRTNVSCKSVFLFTECGISNITPGLERITSQCEQWHHHLHEWLTCDRFLFVKTFISPFNKNLAFYGSPLMPGTKRLNVTNDKN